VVVVEDYNILVQVLLVEANFAGLNNKLEERLEHWTFLYFYFYISYIKI
jgi:hypothetical protein